MNVLSNDEIIISDPNEEVKKLQDLVRKLELQNNELRRKQDVNHLNELKKADSDNSYDKNDAYKTYKKTSSSKDIKNLSLETVDIIDIDELEELSDDDTWLFSPPRELTPEQRKVTAQQWMNKDFDNPNDLEVHTVRKALVHKLDEIIRASPLSSNSVASSRLVQPDHNTSKYVPSHTFTRPNKSLSRPVVDYVAPDSNNSSRLPGSREIDTRTFTRPKTKRRELFPFDTNAYENNNGTNHAKSESPIERLQDVDVPPEFNELCSLESSMTASGLYKFHGVEEVQEMARMQEASLRRSTSSTSSPKHSSSGSNSREHLSYHVNEDGMYINHVDVGEDADNYASGYNDEDSDSKNHSTTSSPLDSSHVKTYHSSQAAGDKIGRSLPNLRRGYTLPEKQNVAPPQPTYERQRDNYNTSSSSTMPNYTRKGSLPMPQAVSNLRTNKPIPRSFNSSSPKKSPSKEQINMPSPSAVSNGPPKSGLPRPGSRLPTPKSRSQLPVPSSSRLPTYNR